MGLPQKETTMSFDRNTRGFTRHAGMSRLGRILVCAIVACALTAMLWGEVGKAAAQAAQKAIAEQGAHDQNVMMRDGVVARPGGRRAAPS
jgi:cell division protein FtsB